MTAKTQSKVATNGHTAPHTPARPGRLAMLEQQVSEQQARLEQLAKVVAMLLSERMQKSALPQMQQQIFNQLMGKQPDTP